MESQEWLRSQLTTFSCASCGQSYVRSRIRVLAQRDDLWFVSLRCAKCGSSALGLVTVKDADEEASETAPLFSDLTDADRERLADGPTVDSDDLIEAHRFLGRFDGDFRRLFGGGEGR
jgi:hypothetical protein